MKSKFSDMRNMRTVIVLCNNVNYVSFFIWDFFLLLVLRSNVGPLPSTVAHCQLSRLYVGLVSSPRITPNIGWVRFLGEDCEGNRPQPLNGIIPGFAVNGDLTAFMSDFMVFNPCGTYHQKIPLRPLTPLIPAYAS